MHNRRTSLRTATRAAWLTAAWLAVAGTTAAQAHHPMGGTTPTTFMHGLLSGFGHPIIGVDHLAFIVAMGIAVGVAGLSLALPVVFVAASSLGVALHVAGLGLPAVEIAVAVSVVCAGALIAWGGAVPAAGWAALFAVAGLFHGYAFGETVAGAEPAPIAAYLIGLAVVQTVLAVAVAFAVRRLTAAPMLRLAGAAIALVGIVFLAGHVMAA